MTWSSPKRKMEQETVQRASKRIKSQQSPNIEQYEFVVKHWKPKASNWDIFMNEMRSDPKTTFHECQSTNQGRLQLKKLLQKWVSENKKYLLANIQQEGMTVAEVKLMLNEVSEEPCLVAM